MGQFWRNSPACLIGSSSPRLRPGRPAIRCPGLRSRIGLQDLCTDLAGGSKGRFDSGAAADSARQGAVPAAARRRVALAQRGVPATQVAEWAGHSVHVLLKVYAKCIEGQDEAARRRIQEALGDVDDQGDAA
jgi:hypothetical protein